MTSWQQRNFEYQKLAEMFFTKEDYARENICIPPERLIQQDPTPAPHEPPFVYESNKAYYEEWLEQER